MGFLSSVGNMAEDVGKSAIGMVDKAQLIFSTSETAESNSLPGQDAVSGAVEALSQKGRKKAANKLEMSVKPSPCNSHAIHVQYNPASISLQASASPIPFQMMQDNINAGIPNQQTRPPSICLSVDLIFDDMNPVDAFMADKFMLLNGGSAGNLASIGGGIYRAAAGKVYSVQKQTNALLAAALRNSTREVTFYWSHMTFTGELTEVNASYDMFSVSGRPIRSTVKIRITQEVSGNGGGSWDRAFDKVFVDETSPKPTGGRGFGNNAGNLLNFNF